MSMNTDIIATCACMLSGFPVFGMNMVESVERGNIPFRVHVFEDYETEIEKRWRLRGEPTGTSLAHGFQAKRVANRNDEFWSGRGIACNGRYLPCCKGVESAS